MYHFSYNGHVPTMKFDYGETYGNHTEKYFQDFRSKTLETSKTNYCKGGYFPSKYSFSPDIAVGARTRQWDRWLQEPRYQLTTLDYDRKQELIDFDRVANNQPLTMQKKYRTFFNHMFVDVGSSITP